MKIAPLRKLIQTHFKDNWTFTDFNRIVFGDNREKLSVKDGAWARISYTVLSTKNAQIGTDFQRATGIITFQIFTGLETGDKEGEEISDAFSEIFQNAEFDGVTCYTVTPIKIGKNGESYQTNAKVNFQYDVFS